jgi:hypothetical protein
VESAERIAKVVNDLKTGRYNLLSKSGEALKDSLEALLYLLEQSPVIDATMIYRNLVANKKPIDVYGDHVMFPPWRSAVVSYVNEHGNVICMLLLASETHEIDSRNPALARWETDNEVDWERVEWVYLVNVWCGGHTATGEAVVTTGPLHMWEIAVYPDGEMADFHWVQLSPDVPMEQWDMAGWVVLGTINFMNCVNVELVEPVRPRAVRRRMERSGVRVTEIHVRPISKSYRGTGGGTSAGVPLHSVRGHFARYGPKYDRALLFGKYEGRYWIPAHARGSSEYGSTEQTYVIETEK